MYKGLVICDRGFETECADEIKELVVASDVVIAESAVMFTVSERSDLLALCYRSQMAIKVLELLGNAPFNKDTLVENCTKMISQKDVLSPWVSTGRTFKIVSRFDASDAGHDPLAVASAVGSAVFTTYSGCVVNVKTPQTVICVYVIDNTLYVGVDYSHENLAKREYKIFINATAIRATVGAGMLRAAGFTSKKTLLDPFSGSGTIAVEAGLQVMHQSPMYYKKEYLPLASYPFFTEIEAMAFLEKLDSDRVGADSKTIFGYDIAIKNVDSSKKNAKIAGVLDAIHFSRVEVDWIDLKLPFDGIDCIVSAPPMYRDAVPKESVDKIYKQLFHRMRDLLTRNGVVLLLVNQPNSVKALIPEAFQCVELRPVWMGQASLFLLKIVRK